MKTNLCVAFAVGMACTSTAGIAQAPPPCTQANALAVQISGTAATAYLPNGAWEIPTTGIRVVPLEGGGSPGSIATPGYVDSCASNPVTGQTVCTATDTDVYLITGSSLNTTLTSRGNGTVGFSGGQCGNCGLAINTATNTAYIEEGIAVQGGGSTTALQSLDLNTNSFGRVLKLNNGLSESILVDPVRGGIASAAENSTYDLIRFDHAGRPVEEFGNYIDAGEFDSSGEDCLTGLIIGTIEFTGDLYFASFDHASFNRGAGTWSDNRQLVKNYPEFDNLSAGTTGISVAPGTHYAVLAGEFGGNLFGVLHLPSDHPLRQGGLHDYVVATMPTDPAGYTFGNGYDPHSVTSFTSPNNGKAYAVLADWGSGTPDYLAVVDIAALLAAPRVHSSSNGFHEVNPNYDLIANGVLTYVKTY